MLMTRSTIGWVLGMLLSLPLFSQFNEPTLELDGDTATYPSLLWEISGNQLTKSCYLYGTMHVSQKLAFHLSDSFYVNLQACDLVALELNPETWLNEIVEKEINLNPYGGVGYDEHDNDFYRTAFAFETADNELIASALSADDVLLNSLLYRSSGDGMTEFEEETYLDLYIYQTGKKLGLDIRALEDFDQVNAFQRQAMKPSEEDDKRDTRKYLREMTRNGKSPRQLLEDAYREGDLNMVDSLNSLLNPFSNWNKYMLIERNKIMVRNLDSLMHYNTVFAGVGAAHLPGEDGMIDLLRERGYTLRPVDRKIGGKSRKYELEIDRKEVPVELQTAWAPDSSFSWRVPGEMYEMPGTRLYREFIHPNMANGAYYWVKRIRTNAALNGQDGDYTRQRLDSLLYENIPGEILSQEDLMQDGFPAVEIRNKTRKGDHQRFRLVITPLELYIFKMGGTLDYVERNSDPVFNSIQLHLKNGDNWERATPGEGGFSVEMPANHMPFRFRQGGFPGVELQGMDNQGQLYQATRRVYHDLIYIEEDRFELMQLALAHLEGKQWDTVRTSFTTFQGYPALDVLYAHEDDPVFLTGRFFIHGPEYYALTRYSRSDATPSEWYDSFQFEDLATDRSMEMVEDTTLWFTCMSYPIHPAIINYNTMSSFMELDLEDDDVDFSETYNNKLLQHGYNGDEVFVRAKRYNKFYTVSDVDELWEREKAILSDDSLLVVTELDRATRDSLETLTLLLTDTNSTRGIHVHLVHYKDLTFAIKSNVDTDMGVRPFAQEVINTFKVLPDTLEHTSVTCDKVDLFFDYIAGGDSATIAESFEYIYYLDFKPDHFDRLTGLFDAFPYGYAGIEEKAALVRAIGRTEHPGISDWYRSFYSANQDTSQLQIAVLKGLASMRSKKGHQALAALLTESTPVPSDRHALYQLYSPLRDSLELLPPVVDELRKLNPVEEYYGFNTRLFSEMFSEDVLSKKQRKAFKDTYLLQASIELKRQRADEVEAADEDDGPNLRESLQEQANEELLHYAAILLPWYEKDSRVQMLIDGIMDTDNPFLETTILVAMVKRGMPVDQARMDARAKDVRTRFALYEGLQYIDRLDLFTAKYLNLASIMDATLWSEYLFENDTADVELLQTIYIPALGSDGGEYALYKGARKDYRDEKEWFLFISGPFHVLDDGTVDIEHARGRRLKRIDNDERIDEMLKDIIRDITYAKRKRYRKKDAGGYDLF